MLADLGFDADADADAEASHWLEVDGAMDCRHYYDTGILWSRSLIMAADDPMPSFETLPAWFADLARRRAARE